MQQSLCRALLPEWLTSNGVTRVRRRMLALRRLRCRPFAFASAYGGLRMMQPASRIVCRKFLMLLLLLPLQLELSGTGDRKLWRMRRGLVFGGRGWGGPLPAILSVAWFVIRRPCSAATTAAAAAHAVAGGATFGPQRRQLDRVGRGGHAYV